MAPGCMASMGWVIHFSILQVARAGRFGTKGLAITFVSDETDAKILNSVQDRFEVNITALPAEIDVSSYSEWIVHFTGSAVLLVISFCS